MPFPWNKLKLHPLAGLLIGVVFIGCSPQNAPHESESPEIHFAVETGRDAIHTKRFSIRQGKEEFFAYMPNYRIGVMKKVSESDDGILRTEFQAVDGQTDFESCLLAIKGDDDERYLVITDWTGGKGVNDYQGYLVDTKDNFAIIGPVPAGDEFAYPVPNPELLFEFQDPIGSFGSAGCTKLKVVLKIAKGMSPEVIVPDEKWTPLRLNRRSYRKLSKEHGIYKLCCDLMNSGQFHKFETAAKVLGFTEAEIKQYQPLCIEKIRESKLYPYLLKIN